MAVHKNLYKPVERCLGGVEGREERKRERRERRNTTFLGESFPSVRSNSDAARKPTFTYPRGKQPSTLFWAVKGEIIISLGKNEETEQTLKLSQGWEVV